MRRLIVILKVGDDLNDPESTVASIQRGIPFRGMHLWILIFATIIASVGLNINSTAVIIGAMLISPLMGPIMGIGLGVGINDLELVRNAAKNFGFAIFAALAASTLYFVVSPISEAHSELLARTTPAIWDVIIAFFGGLAAMVAIASKEKWIVLPGAAIATALMPPLCTAGFGVANGRWNIVLGALYLFTINAVFIAVASAIIVRALDFPIKHYSNQKRERRVKRWILAIVLATGVPSIYVAYNVVKQNEFKADARTFISNEAVVPENYLLNKEIDAQKRKITLTYGGQGLTYQQKQRLTSQLSKYNLQGAQLTINEGFSLRELEPSEIGVDQDYLTTINKQQVEIKSLHSKLDSIKNHAVFEKQLIKEAKALQPNLVEVSFSRLNPSDSVLIAYMRFRKRLKQSEREQINDWLQAKLSNNKFRLILDN